MNQILSSHTIESIIRMQEEAERVSERFIREMPKFIEARERAAEMIARSIPNMQSAIERIAQTMSSPIFQDMQEKQMAAVLEMHNKYTNKEAIMVNQNVEVEVTETEELEGIPCLPENADLLDQKIALELRENEIWLHFRVQSGWVRERIKPQAYQIIRFLRDQARYPDDRTFRLTDLCKNHTEAISSDVKRSSISNRLRELQDICKTHGAKPLIIKEALRYRYNPRLES